MSVRYKGPASTFEWPGGSGRVYVPGDLMPLTPYQVERLQAIGHYFDPPDDFNSRLAPITTQTKAASTPPRPEQLGEAADGDDQDRAQPAQRRRITSRANSR